MGNSFRIYQDIKLAFGEMDLVGMVRIKFKTRHTYQKQKKKKNVSDKTVCLDCSLLW